MACFGNGVTTTSTSTNISNANNGTIAQLLIRIDQLQKEAIIANATNQCDNCMISSMFNTKPIAIYICCNGTRFEAAVGTTGETANLFRVEEVRNDETVVLRLLTEDDATGEITCTTYTIVVRISCIGVVQCFDPINCDTLCSQLI